MSIFSWLAVIKWIPHLPVFKYLLGLITFRCFSFQFNLSGPTERKEVRFADWKELRSDKVINAITSYCLGLYININHGAWTSDKNNPTTSCS